MPKPTGPRGARTYELDRTHVFHSWSAQDLVDPMVIARSVGSYVFDADDKAYLDFSGQLVYTNIGHRHPPDASGRFHRSGQCLLRGARPAT